MKKYYFHLAPTHVAQDGTTVFSSQTTDAWRQILDEYGIVAEEPSGRGCGIKVGTAPDESFVYLMHYDDHLPRDAYITLYSAPSNDALDVLRALASAGHAHMSRLPQYVGEDTGPPAFCPGTPSVDEKGRNGIRIDTNDEMRAWLKSEIGGQDTELSEAQPYVFSHWFFYFLLHTCNSEGRLTEDEIDDVCDVFDDHAVEDPELYGDGYILRVKPFSLGFNTDNLNSVNSVTSIPVELLVYVEQIPDDPLTIILEVARAGNFALMNAEGDHVCIVDCDQTSEASTKWPNAKMLSSPTDLLSWLEDTVTGQRFLDSAADVQRVWD